MAREACPGNTLLTFFLMIITVFSAFNTKTQILAQAQGPFSYLKLSIQWPKSFCNTGNYNCRYPIKTYFTVNGFWPMYWWDHRVPPYHKQDGCTRIVPLEKGNITENLLHSILDDMKWYWPVLKYKAEISQEEGNVILWRKEWEERGMCYNNPDFPLIYFQDTIHMIKKYNVLEMLDAGEIRPDNEEHFGRHMVQSIHNSTGADPEIVCNEDASGSLQLLGVNICIRRNFKEAHPHAILPPVKLNLPTYAYKFN
ncbi:ribonuclease 2-like [Tripterygium wilfordii]|uniref:ribonuclease 2-like n=1 Tax=Tripterygium wilfordii TaxID=458696 RepID=UPI0018F7FF4B|nr:ribonuclease 2-like [Tripterygium wilfordii]